MSKGQSTLRRPGKNLTAKFIEHCQLSGKFYTRSVAQSGRPFFIFSEYGDMIAGQLVSGPHDNSHINRSRSYIIEAVEKVESGERSLHPELVREEFFANRQIHQVINQHELLGKFIRIVFIGRMKGYKGHNSKVYEIFLEKGVLQSQEESLNGPDKQKSHRPTE